jgi:hypothetical protein
VKEGEAPDSEDKVITSNGYTILTEISEGKRLLIHRQKVGG